MIDRLTVSAALAGALFALGGCYHGPDDPFLPDEAKAREIRAALAKNTSAAGAGTSTAPKQTRSGWATLKGSFIVVGSPPTPPTVNINKDPQVCQPGGHPVLSQVFVINPAGGGLAYVAVYALGVDTANVHESAAPGKPDEVPFDQKQCVFLSHVQALRIGQKLKVLNSDPISHNTLIRGTPEMNQTIGPGQSILYTPARPERSPVNVECSIHPWMRAYLLPHENGYAAVTGTDGGFEIANLPAGIDLKIQVWHETLKNFGDITVDGKKAAVSRGAISIRLEPEKSAVLEARIPASAFQ